jgi:hypothetical protein
VSGLTKSAGNGRIALSTILLLIFTCPAHTQWVVQHTGLFTSFPDPSIQVSVVNDQIYWELPWVPAHVARTTDVGTSWSISIPDTSSGLRGACLKAISATTAWVGLWDTTDGTSRVYRTTDGGQHWNQQNAFPGTGGFPDVIHFFDGDNGVAIGDPRTGGTWEIYTTSTGGDQWNLEPASSMPPPVPGEVGWTGSYASVGQHIWFSTSAGALYRSSDLGSTWAVTRGIGIPFMALDFTDTLHGLTLGTPFKRTTDGGVTWIPFAHKSFPSNLSPVFLAGVPGTRGSYVTTAVANSSLPGSAYTVDDGDTWTLIDRDPHAITRFSSAASGWSVGTGDTVYTWTGGQLSPSVALRLDNPSIDFQTVRTGSVSDTMRTAIVNWGRNPLIVSSLSHADVEILLTNPPALPATVLPTDNDRLVLNFLFRPTQPGHVTLDSVILASNDSSQPRTTILLRGRGSATVAPPLNDVGYAILVDNRTILVDTLDLTRGNALPLNALSPGPPPDIQGLTVRGSDGLIYGSNSTPSETRLYRISSQGGDFDFAGTVPLGGVRGIYFTQGDTLILSDSTGRIFGMKSLTSMPFRIDSSGTPLYSFARSPTTGQLWGVSQFGIYKINPSPWSKTLVGTFPGVLRPSIAIGKFGTIYGLFDGDLFDIDRLSGVPRLIGSTGNPNFRGLVLHSGVVGSVGENNQGIPDAFALRQNYPNPFNPTTTIEFDLPSRIHAELRVFDILGRLVATLADEELPAGRYARVLHGTSLSSGVYYVRLRAGSFTSTRSLILLR